MKGKFITFEGIDGSGKTTIAKEVFTRLKNSGRDVILTLELDKEYFNLLFPAKDILKTRHMIENTIKSFNYTL